MRLLKADNCCLTVAVGLGDTIVLKSQLDQLSKTKEVKISYSKDIIKTHIGINNDAYYNFIKEWGKLFFSSAPYIITDEQFVFRTVEDLYFHEGLAPVATNYCDILCDPNYQNNLKNYIVVNTKMRLFKKSEYIKLKDRFFNILRDASEKYKVVILGERKLEYNEEYKTYGSELAYTIYDDILNSVPTNKILDMTVETLGNTVPSLDKIRKDCCILRDCKYSITIGYGGQFCLSMATANKHVALCQQHSEPFGVGICLIGQRNGRFLPTDNINEFLAILARESI